MDITGIVLFVFIIAVGYLYDHSKTFRKYADMIVPEEEDDDEDNKK